MLLVLGAGLSPPAIVASWSPLSVSDMRNTKVPSRSRCAWVCGPADRGLVTLITVPLRMTSSQPSPRVSSSKKSRSIAEHRESEKLSWPSSELVQTDVHR